MDNNPPTHDGIVHIKYKNSKEFMNENINLSHGNIYYACFVDIPFVIVFQIPLLNLEIIAALMFLTGITTVEDNVH